MSLTYAQMLDGLRTIRDSGNVPDVTLAHEFVEQRLAVYIDAEHGLGLTEEARYALGEFERLELVAKALGRNTRTLQFS